MPDERQLFTKLFLERGNKGPMRPSDFAREIMVLGLFTFYKWDHGLAWEQKHNHPNQTKRLCPPDELANFQLTDQRVSDLEHSVASALNAYVDQARPVHGFWYRVGQSITGSFIYSLILVTLLLIVVLGDVDLPKYLGIELTSITRPID